MKVVKYWEKLPASVLTVLLIEEIVGSSIDRDLSPQFRKVKLFC